MRLLILGDIHLEHFAVSRALDRFLTSCDRAFSVGDIMDGIGGGNAAKLTLHVLRTRGIECIAGNHDRWLLANQLEAIRAGRIRCEGCGLIVVGGHLACGCCPRCCVCFALEAPHG